MSVSIRRPVAKTTDRCAPWPPDPAKVVGIIPIAIGIEIFCAPNVFVEILDVVLESLRQKLLTLANPIVNRITRCSGEKFPVAGSFTDDKELSRATIAQSEA